MSPDLSHMAQNMQQLTRFLNIYSMCIVAAGCHFSSGPFFHFKDDFIQEYSRIFEKIGLILKVSTSSINWPKPKNDISRFRNILGIQ